MANFFKLAGYDYNEPRGEITIEHEDNGIRLFVDVFASTDNDDIDFECQAASLEQVDGIFIKAQSIQELVGRRFVWDTPENENGYAGVLNVVEYEQISKAEFMIESIIDGIATVYWRGIGDIRWDEPFDIDVPFETRVTIPLPNSTVS
ncbi:MAG: hypothetical protein IKS42_12175 [Oscillospiraceae bacterium]|nr:hypothetical protein [Oscillospiraceae bacterium]